MGVTAEISKQQRHKALQKPKLSWKHPKHSDVVHATALTTPENPPGNPNFISPRTRVTHLQAKKTSTFCENSWIVKISTSGTALSEQEKRGPPKPGPSQTIWDTKKSLPWPQNPPKAGWPSPTALSGVFSES